METLNKWESEIIEAFTQRYAAAASRSIQQEDGNALEIRLRLASVFPGFYNAGADDKDLFLEAAESLEARGIIKIKWEKHGKGERVKTITCKDAAKLFEITGGKNPETELAEAKKIIAREAAQDAQNAPFLVFIAENLNSPAVTFKINSKAIKDFVKLLQSMSVPRLITTRALSAELYNDSKRLEHIIELFTPLVNKARSAGIITPDISFYTRSFPEVMLAGKLVFEYKDSSCPLVNERGVIIAFPYTTVQMFSAVRPLCGNRVPSVLTIENKETFYALAQDMNRRQTPRYDCVIYSGGYPNDACTLLLRLLASPAAPPQWNFFHSGDLDPAGILIMQNINDITGGQEPRVKPVFMDAETFDAYLPFARRLSPAALKEISKIRPKTRAISGINELITRIELTNQGLEQEVIKW